MDLTLAKQNLWTSEKGRTIELHRLTSGAQNILLVGGVHGDEPEGFYLVERFMLEGKWQELEGELNLWVVPRLNPDGCAEGNRRNARGVDLNRNLPTKDWTSEAKSERYFPGPSAGSEFENQVLIQLVEKLAPLAIISAHSWEPMINYNGPAEFLAAEMAKYNQYKISDDIGYPTPGSLGTWAGWERKIPTITLEIERGSAEEAIWKQHSEALSKGLLFAAHNRILG